MKGQVAIEDFYRGVRFISGSLLIMVLVFFAAIFFFSGIIGALIFEEAGLGLVVRFTGIAAGILIVPYVFYWIGKRLG